MLMIVTWKSVEVFSLLVQKLWKVQQNQEPQSMDAIAFPNTWDDH